MRYRFHNLVVESYGTLATIAQVSLMTSSKLSISVYDPDAVKYAADAIRDCGLNLNPMIEGNTIIVNIPKPSKEYRENLVKSLAKISEKVIYMSYYISTRMLIVTTVPPHM
jgi:ribosome recycling factor